MRYLIGLDLGTTTVKATVYQENGTPIAEHSLERIILTPQEGYFEQNADTWYEDSCAVIKEATKHLKKEEVKGISISSQGITVVPVDDSFNPLYNAINWMDVRPVDSWNGLLDSVGIDYVLKTTGYPVSYNVPKAFSKIMWLRDNQPDIYLKTKYFLMPASFVTAKFTGNVLTDHTMAVGSLLYSLKEKKYDEKLLKATSIDEEFLPPIVPMGTCAGNLTSEAAKDCDLTTDCIVVVGGQDQKIAAYGLGIKKGQIACSMGTSAAFEFAVDSCEFENIPTMFKVCPFDEDNYVFEGVIKTGGGAIRWLRDTICIGSDYKQMDAEAESAPIGSHGTVFVPYLGGSPDNKNFASFNNVGLHTEHGDLIRAVYEGVAFEAARVIKDSGIDVSEIRIYSGGSKNRLLCQIISDVTNIPVIAYEHSEMGSLGAAKLAAKCIGIDETDFTNECLKKSTTFMPKNADEYKTYYEQYLNYLKG